MTDDIDLKIRDVVDQRFAELLGELAGELSGRVETWSAEARRERESFKAFIEATNLLASSSVETGISARLKARGKIFKRLRHFLLIGNRNG